MKKNNDKNNKIIGIIMIIVGASLLIYFLISIIKNDDIQVENAKININVGETTTLKVIKNKETINNEKISWTSSDNNIATVNEYGVVKGVNDGIVTINGTYEENTIYFEVTVKKIEISMISLEAEKNIDVGEKTMINAIIIPSNANERNISWQSSDPSIVTVDEHGNIEGIKEGEVTITATAYNGITASCKINVSVKAQEIILDIKEKNIILDEKFTISAIINPSNTTDKNIYWTSSDATVATVDEKGNVHGIKEGTAIITAKTSNEKIATCKVSVIKLNYNFNCNGTIDQNGTNVNVTGESISKVKKFEWNLDKKKLNGTSNYQNSKKGFKSISVELTLIDNTKKTVKCSIKDKLPYHFEANNDKPLYTSGFCGKISDAENQKLNNMLYEIINDVGMGTRAGVVEAGRFLMGNIPFIVTYQGHSGNNIYTSGLHFGTETNSWGCRKNGHINGMDCTGFMNWPFNTNGIKRTYSNAPQPVAGNIDKIRVGDVLLSYDASKQAIYGRPFGHDEIIIGIDDEYIYTLSNGLTKTSKKNPPSSSTNCRNGDCSDSEHHNAYYRNVIYSNGDGKLTNMWIEWD